MDKDERIVVLNVIWAIVVVILMFFAASSRGCQLYHDEQQAHLDAGLVPVNSGSGWIQKD